MVTYITDNGRAEVESSGEDFWLVSLLPDSGFPHELYVAARSPVQAVQKAYQFWFRKHTETLYLL